MGNRITGAEVTEPADVNLDKTVWTDMRTICCMIWYWSGLFWISATVRRLKTERSLNMRKPEIQKEMHYIYRARLGPSVLSSRNDLLCSWKKPAVFKSQFFHLRNKDKSDLTYRRGRKGGVRILFDHCELLGLMGQELSFQSSERERWARKKENEKSTEKLSRSKWWNFGILVSVYWKHLGGDWRETSDKTRGNT